MTAAAARELAGFIARYDRPVAALARAALVRLRRHLPGATELVYDNYNALVIGFGPGERASDAIVSLALYPRWVTLFFLRGAGLPDPGGRLSGSGSRVRGVRLSEAGDIDSPDVVALLRAALARATTPIDPDRRRKLVIRSVSARQRPRRPSKRPRARA